MRLKICLCLFSFLICLSLFTLSAEADTIKIKDGGTIQGIIIEESADKVIVELKYGKMTLSRDNIESISKSSKETNDALKKNWEICLLETGHVHCLRRPRKRRAN